MTDTDTARAEPPSRGRLPFCSLRPVVPNAIEAPAKVNPTEMDSQATGRYLQLMIARAITVLALLVVVFLTTVAPSHVANMRAGTSHAFHADLMIHNEVGGAHGCAGQHACTEADAETCEFVCTGLTAFASVSNAGAPQYLDPTRHQLPSGTRAESRSPDLTERPPKPRLL